MIYSSIHLLLEQVFLKVLLSVKHLAGPSIILSSKDATLQQLSIQTLQYKGMKGT
jgi:hypothetical protein